LLLSVQDKTLKLGKELEASCGFPHEKREGNGALWKVMVSKMGQARREPGSPGGIWFIYIVHCKQ
jgi:hypothetical protein